MTISKKYLAVLLLAEVCVALHYEGTHGVPTSTSSQKDEQEAAQTQSHVITRQSSSVVVQHGGKKLSASSSLVKQGDTPEAMAITERGQQATLSEDGTVKDAHTLEARRGGQGEDILD